MIEVLFKLDGNDYSNLLSTYSVTHDMEVGKSIITIDGTEHCHVLRRPTVRVSFIPLTETQSAALYNILSAVTVPVYYHDPYLNSDMLLNMRVASSLESAFGLKSIDGNRYYKGSEIELRAKFCL